MSLRKKNFFLKTVHNQRGMTLTELLVAGALTGFTTILMATVLVETTNLSKSFEARARDQVERLTAERQLRNVFLQAVDLKYIGNNSLNNFNGGAGYQGALRAFDSDLEWGTVPETKTLALFWRDARITPLPPQSPLNLSSDLRRTGIFFQMPTATTWGVLYIDLGDNPMRLSPERTDMIFEGLVGVKIQNVQAFDLNSSQPAASFTTPYPVSSFDIELTFRKFINPKGQADFVFCPYDKMYPVPAMPSCKPRTPSRDISTSIRIVVRNNVLTVSPTSNITLPLPPGSELRYGARPYDRVHFFRPLAPSGLL